MTRDSWDKISIIATFIQIVVIGGFTAVVSFYTARMTNRLESYKSDREESEMIKKLVTDLTSDTTSHVRSDFALLSLERYLISSQNGKLKEYDRDMLLGFAQSIIWDRVGNGRMLHNQNEILIPKEFLRKHDSVRYQQILNEFDKFTKTGSLPDSFVAKGALPKAEPVKQTSHTETSEALGVLFNKTCYIQYATPKAKKTAQKFQEKLQQKAWYAPGIDLVEGSYKSSVRYFHKEDLELVKTVKASLDIASFEPLFIAGYQNRVPKGQLELWIGE